MDVTATKQVEEELRRKTRELRPASLGDATLEAALQPRFKELREAGVAATLHVAGVGEAAKLLPQKPLANLWINLEPAHKSPEAKPLFKTPRDPPLTALFGNYLDLVGR